jgi:hypothetical protein
MERLATKTVTKSQLIFEKFDLAQLADGYVFFAGGDEIKLDPNTLSLINAACTQVQARSARARFSFKSRWLVFKSGQF